MGDLQTGFCPPDRGRVADAQHRYTFVDGVRERNQPGGKQLGDAKRAELDTAPSRQLTLEVRAQIVGNRDSIPTNGDIGEA
ncbi:MAG: hypothetical protein QNJ77_06105 [Acidimicrobiia bacterium]|nr:hypothetical protein [Acidimicrobiia bacterium]